MELVLLAFVLLGLPLILSIVALVKASGAKQEVSDLRNQLARALLKLETPRTKSTEPAVQSSPVMEKEPIPQAPKAVAAALEPPPPQSPPPAAVQTPVAPPPPRTPSPSTKSATAEVMFGGKVASFVGIGLLLIGVAFLIGYAIKHAWLGPEARIILGLLCGTIMVALGHAAEIKGKGRLGLLARALTGGGSAVFYFCIYAAYGIYNLIGVQAAGAGLVVCAAAALGLAMAYRSQAVAIIAVLGAFLMPTLIGRESPNTLFLLAYIAVINVPVLALGIYRNWQALYNTAFGFTVLYFSLLLTKFDVMDGRMMIAFSLVYFFQFAALGLIKLHADRDENGRALDIIRLLLNSLGLLGALYLLLEKMDLNQWTGASFIIMALVHIGLVKVGWKWRPSFTHDILALLVGALTFASLALPIQLNGAWVSIGWSIEGAVLCWFALRARIPILQLAAFMLGTIGLLKSLLYDIELYDTAATLFLNARFVSGLLAAGLLSIQGILHKRYAPAAEADNVSDLWTIVPPLAVIGILAVFGSDIFWTLGADSAEAWLLSSFVLLVVVVISALATRHLPMLNQLTRWLLVLVPAKLVVDVLVLSGLDSWQHGRVFANLHFISFTAMILFVLAGLPVILRQPQVNMLGGGVRFANMLNIVALISGILIVTMEIYRIGGNWDQTLVTFWLSGCAISLVAYGLIRRQQVHRLAGLWIFATATLKVLVVDLGELDGLERIAAFMGVGVLLLILSFIYQRASARLLGDEETAS